MGLEADAKDVTIARLAVSLTITGQRADDAEALVAQLRAELADARIPDELAQGNERSDAHPRNDNDRLGREDGYRRSFGVEAHEVQEEVERHTSPLATSNGVTEEV